METYLSQARQFIEQNPSDVAVIMAVAVALAAMKVAIGRYRMTK